MQIYITYFFIYACFGWVMEVAFNGLKEGRYINCGVLNGPYCPIYGFAAVFILLALDTFNVENKIVLFLLAMFIASVVEFITGVILEKLTGSKWWDYSDKPFNLMGHICLEYALMFGAVGFILHEAIHPLIARFVGWLPNGLRLAIVVIFIIIFVIDVIHTFNTILGINNKFRAIELSSERIGQATSNIGAKIAHESLEAKEGLENKRREIEDRSELIDLFDKNAEKRILKAFPNLIRDLEDRGYDLENFKNKFNQD